MRILAGLFGGCLISGVLLVGACYGAAYLAVETFPWQAFELLGTPLAVANEIDCGTQTTPAPGVTPTPYPTWIAEFLTRIAENAATPSCSATPPPESPL